MHRDISKMHCIKVTTLIDRALDHPEGVMLLSHITRKFSMPP